MLLTIVSSCSAETPPLALNASRDRRLGSSCAGWRLAMFFFALSWLFVIPARAGDVPAATSPSSPVPLAQSTPSVSLLSWMETSADTEIAGNPGAVNGKPGIGLLGRALGLDPDSIFLGGVWVGNADYLFGGGADPKSWNLNSLAIVATDVNLEKLIGFPGGEFGAEFLQFDGQDANGAAGVVTGYDGLPGPPPLNRSELYELWWRQRLFDDKLSIRFGKVVPTYDFDNVIRPIPVHDERYSIPAVTGVTYTPIFVNPTILGAMPGYYNSAYGITTTFTPTKHLYVMYGVYDGTSGDGRQTGISATSGFQRILLSNRRDRHLLVSLGPNICSAIIGLGGWGQTGQLTAGRGASAIHQNGTGGFYTFGSQRLWCRHPGTDNSGVTGFFQFGINNSTTMIASKYFGTGLTTFGLVPDRPTIQSALAPRGHG